MRFILRIWYWNIETYKTIKSITPCVMFFNNKGNKVLEEEAQLVTKIREIEQSDKKKSS
ncbi:MAG: hypothetical protein PV340_02610 [Wolbachia sp.]|nr:hypothetical protein [Wolbachia sp.]MDD9335967.1 hypothetical protein [Wolbachia sp.]